jgi:hypothetical protein
MTTRSFVIGFVLTAAGCAVGSPGATVREPVELLAGLRSYESPAESRARLPGAVWTLRSLGSPGPEDKRPKYEKQSAELRWRECGQEGTLILTFVNERLYLTTFVPTDMEACAKELTARGIISRSPNPDTSRRVQTGEFEGKPFVSATDMRLESEIDAWISRYS